ncbi:hypothetical protein [Gynuella sp.]|uniref:hypothetical protein n=1 Tax=Gynuella sp. TaxID=2969146 RepID=UPI003D09A4CF
MSVKRKQLGFIQLSRTTLWILIIVLIPLVVVLNNMGSKTEKQSVPETIYKFDISSLAIGRLGADRWVNLPGSGLIALSVAQKRMPVNRVDVPEHQDFSFSFRNGMAVTRVVIPATQAQLELTLDFLDQWLSPVMPDDILVMSGEVDAGMLESVRTELHKAKGKAVDVAIPAPTALSVIASPPFGSPDQLAMIVAADILSHRMAGYDLQLRWDHQRTTSYLTLNTTIQPDWLRAPSEQEYVAALQPLKQFADVSLRSPAQIHRYLTAMAIYHLPDTFISHQTERLEALTLQQVQQVLQSFNQ